MKFLFGKYVVCICYVPCDVESVNYKRWCSVMFGGGLNTFWGQGLANSCGCVGATVAVLGPLEDGVQHALVEGQVIPDRPHTDRLLCAHTHTLTHPFTYSLSQSLIHSFIHFLHSFSHSLDAFLLLRFGCRRGARQIFGSPRMFWTPMRRLLNLLHWLRGLGPSLPQGLHGCRRCSRGCDGAFHVGILSGFALRIRLRNGVRFWK